MGVILNGVKNLKSVCWCYQILRKAQDDTMDFYLFGFSQSSVNTPRVDFG